MAIPRNQFIDLHVHTTASDGTLKPQEVVAYAYNKGLKAIAITDHDTIQGVAEALQAGREVGLEVIPGVEISVGHSGGELHLLGYLVDINSPVLREGLQQLQEYREQRNPQMITKLRNLGIELTLEEVEAIAVGDIIGRPHFAAVLVEKGIVQDKQQAFDRYLAHGRPAYVKKEKLTPQQGIQLVLAAGGIPVLAHPKYLPESTSPEKLRSLLRELKNMGLKGLEVYYSKHSPEEEQLYRRLAKEEGLLITGGTDFHGGNTLEIELGIGLGNLRIPYVLAERLKTRHQEELTPAEFNPQA
ncbi:MAG: PHP domain-containing protein [Carboxydocellales bacterium]